MEKNGKNGTFFYKERKRTARTECSFEKNGCPTLPFSRVFLFNVGVFSLQNTGRCQMGCLYFIIFVTKKHIKLFGMLVS